MGGVRIRVLECGHTTLDYKLAVTVSPEEAVTRERPENPRRLLTHPIITSSHVQRPQIVREDGCLCWPAATPVAYGVGRDPRATGEHDSFPITERLGLP